MVPADGGRAADQRYRPILKGCRGELDALVHLDPGITPLITPILEVVATDRGPVHDAYRFLSDLRERPPRARCVGVDLSGLPTGAPDRRYLACEVGDKLAGWGIPLLPVIGLADSDSRIAEHGEAARTHLHRAIVRLRPRQDSTGHDAPADAVERVWRLARLVPQQCDLVIDMAEVGCAGEVREAQVRVRRLVEWARRHAWRSVTVAAGAMPATLSGVPTDRATRVGRWDWLLWRGLSDLGVDYGDYGISPPLPAPSRPRAPVSTLRYAAEQEWWIYRWSRRGGARGDDRFHHLCRTLVTADHWAPAGATFSWGDREISRRARYALGPGSATCCLAWGTSHHLAQVAAQLTQQSLPPAGNPSRSGDRAARQAKAGRPGSPRRLAWPPHPGGRSGGPARPGRPDWAG